MLNLGQSTILDLINIDFWFPCELRIKRKHDWKFYTGKGTYLISFSIIRLITFFYDYVW